MMLLFWLLQDELSRRFPYHRLELGVRLMYLFFLIRLDFLSWSPLKPPNPYL